MPMRIGLTLLTLPLVIKYLAVEKSEEVKGDVAEEIGK